MRSIVILPFVAQALAQTTYNLTLPWGIWQSTYDSSGDVYKFENVRFGAPPTGSLRFQPAQYPSEKNNNIQKGSDASCHQIDTTQRECSPGGNNQVVPPIKSVSQSEDCLFLDIYVPSKIMQNAKSSQTAPVAVWLFGGAFLFGSKNYMMNDPYNTPFYDGTGLIDNTDSTIFVAGNYRLGALGWLAGITMEKDGYPNAGLSDQRLLFDFVYHYISQVGGDKGKVAAWGESAGASSILHHLVSRNGSQQLVPRFQRAALQSPAYQWISDRSGYMEQTFINYTCLVCWAKTSNRCCPENSLQTKALYTVKELQSFDSSNLTTANQWLFQSTQRCNGLFPVGPSVDRNVIQNLADVEFASGRFAPLDSIILSHVHNEAASFVNPPTVASDSDYLKLLDTLFHGFPGVVQSIAAKYSMDHFPNQMARLQTTIQDMVFLSNNRIMFDAYSATKTKVYTMSWNFFTASAERDYSYHASDVPALFYRSNWNFTGWIEATYPPLAKLGPILKRIEKTLATKVAPIYQTYFTQHALNGDPNGGKGPSWSTGIGHLNGVGNTMTVEFAFGLGKFESQLDPLLPEDLATFWISIAEAVDPLAKAQDDLFEAMPLFSEDL